MVSDPLHICSGENDHVIKGFLTVMCIIISYMLAMAQGDHVNNKFVLVM